MPSDLHAGVARGRARTRALEQQRPRRAAARRRSQTLPETLRTAVLLRDIQELSYQEIADRLRLPEGTVKSRINRGRTELARQIQRLRDERLQPDAARPPADRAPRDRSLPNEPHDRTRQRRRRSSASAKRG